MFDRADAPQPSPHFVAAIARAGYRAQLADCPLFAGVSPEDCARAYESARLRVFSRGDVLYMDEAPVRDVFLLLYGVAKITKCGAAGDIVIVGLGMPGDVLGAADLIATGKHSTTAQPARQGCALVWRAADFRAMVNVLPVLFRNMLTCQHRRSREVEERLQEMATDTIAPRVARQLLRLREKFIRAADESVDLSFSREEVAQMTGTTLFSISRLLVEWEQLGIVTSKRESVRICDVASLRAVSEGARRSDAGLCRNSLCKSTKTRGNAAV